MTLNEQLKTNALRKILKTIEDQQSEVGTASPIETISDLLNTFIVKEGEECSSEYLYDRVYMCTFIISFFAKLNEAYDQYKFYLDKEDD